MTSKGNIILSLENFNPSTKRYPILNSPRSLEACRRQGIDPEELLVKTAEDIRQQNKGKLLDQENLELMARHYEERRREKVRVLIEERAQIIEDENNGLYTVTSPQKDVNKSGTIYLNNSKNAFASIQAGESTLIEKEKRQLEKIKFRQEKEIKNLMEYEKKMAEIREIQEEKMSKQKEKEYMREMEVAEKRRQAEEKKMEQEEMKRRQQEDEEERRRRMAADAFRQEQERLFHEKEMERQRRLDMKRKEEEAKRKHDEFIRKTEEKLIEQQMRVQQKKFEMEERDRVRQEYLRQQQEEKVRIAEERRREKEAKIDQAKKKNEDILDIRRAEFEERQYRSDERKKQFESDLLYRREESRQRAEQHALNIKQVIEENQRIEQAKKDDYLRKKALAEERKRELDAIAEEERRMKAQEEYEKEMQRQQVKHTMENIMSEKINHFRDKQKNEEAKVEFVQKKKHDEHLLKTTIENIKREDRKENVKRISKIQDYQREKIMEKIQEDNMKAEKIKWERQSLLQMRAELKREMDANKRMLTEKFEKVKQGKLNLESLSGEFSGQMSIQAGSTKKPSTSQGFRSVGNNLKEASKSSNKSNQSNDRARPDTVGGGEAEGRKLLDNLKLAQNNEMLKLLEEEQGRENEREQRLESIGDPHERRRIEKVYAMERAKAHARIQKLADTHDDAIRTMVAKYNLKNAV